jgi:hypothetical protein
MPEADTDSPLPNPNATTPIGTKPKLTAEEQEIVDVVSRSHGKEWAEAHVNLILNQARAFGDL